MSTQYEPGAPTTGEMIPLSVPVIHGNEWVYIKECLDTGWVSSVGSFVDRFEQEMAAYVGTKYAIATVNGTAALHLALLAVGIQTNDEVLIPSLTFTAPANAIRYIGAWPVFIDVEPEYWQMDVQRVVAFIEQECIWDGEKLQNKSTRRQVKAILPVHILGHPVDMAPLMEVAHQYKLHVIEDASESLGAKYQDQMVGTFGEIACLSFNGNKLLTTGGGGMVITNDEELARYTKYLSTQAKDDPLEYIHNEVGYNYRLTNIQAAMGVAQLEQIQNYLDIKRQIAQRYRDAFVDTPGITPMPEAAWVKSAFWLYTILVDPAIYGMNSRELLQKLREHHIQSRPLWHPLHLNPAMADAPTCACPNAERLNKMALSVPCSVDLSKSQQDRVIEVVCES